MRCGAIYDCLESSRYARRTTITRLERINFATCIAAVECAAYRGALRLGEQSIEQRTMIGAQVLFLPLGTTLLRSNAAAWNVLWHCESQGHSSALVQVVPRRIGSVWSFAALAIGAAQNSGAVQPGSNKNDKKGLLQVVDRGNRAWNALLPLHTQSCSNDPAFVDLLLNLTLLRTLMHARVAVYMLPRLRSVAVRRVCDSSARYEFSTVDSDAPVSQSFIFDAQTLGANPNCALSAQQLERLLRRSPSIVDASLLPVVSRQHQTLLSFVSQTERRVMYKKNSRVHASSANESVAANNFRQNVPEMPFDSDEDTINDFAQRLLALVDALAPADAIGVLIRPYDLQSTALVEQECPYMLHKVAAFVPAVSKFCESL